MMSKAVRDTPIYSLMVVEAKYRGSRHVQTWSPPRSFGTRLRSYVSGALRLPSFLKRTPLCSTASLLVRLTGWRLGNGVSVTGPFSVVGVGGEDVGWSLLGPGTASLVALISAAVELLVDGEAGDPEEGSSVS